MYTAVIRRQPGGFGLKVAKRSGSLFLSDTCAANLSTFISMRWPRHLTSFLCFGRSQHAEQTWRSGSTRTPRRRSAQLALCSDDPDGGRDADALRLYGGGDARKTLLGEQRAPKPSVSGAIAEAQAPKFNLHQLRLKHMREQPISMVTAYDYPSARIADSAGVDALLVGDSVGMVVLGREDTTEVTMDEMVHHCRAAATGTRRALLVGDLPFGSCLTPVEAARNGVRLVKEGRADAVKLEGGRQMVPQVRALVDAGVAVMGHIGLTPQSHSALGGYRVQGRNAEEASRLLEDALFLQAAGCFAIVLEMVPAPVAALITAQLGVPTIGIGAGGGTSGQVQVFHDLLGLYDQKVPKFVRQFEKLEGRMRTALAAYARAVDERAFPQSVHTFPIADAELGRFRRELGLPVQDVPQAPRAHDAAHAAAPTRPSAVADHNGALRASSASTAAAVATGVSLSGSTAPRVVRTISEWRALQSSGKVPRGKLGLVPTMGALHAGHLSLVHLAQQSHENVAVSIFVNPKQFAAHEDLDQYPRTLEADIEALGVCGVDFVFAPRADDMYPTAQSHRLAPYVDLAGVDEHGEGRARPGFFRGVATVVTKLLNIVQPQALYLGQKDGLQCTVLRRLVEDLNYDVDVVIGPTVRERDGLALSSRNVYLSAEERAAAPAVYAALAAVADAHSHGERSPAALRARAARVIDAQPLMHLEYLSFASMHDGRELSAAAGSDGQVLASIAVRLGSTRLIDNVVLA